MQHLQHLEKEINTVTRRAGNPFNGESIKSEGTDLSDEEQNSDPQSSSTTEIKAVSLSSIMTEFTDREFKFHTPYTISAIKLLNFKVDTIKNRHKNGQKKAQIKDSNTKYAQRDLSPKGIEGKNSPLDRESVHSTVDIVALIDDAGKSISYLFVPVIYITVMFALALLWRNLHNYGLKNFNFDLSPSIYELRVACRLRPRRNTFYDTDLFHGNLTNFHHSM